MELGLIHGDNSVGGGSSSSTAGGTGSTRLSRFPEPEGGSVDDWEIFSEAAVKGAVNRVFTRIQNPRYTGCGTNAGLSARRMLSCCMGGVLGHDVDHAVCS